MWQIIATPVLTTTEINILRSNIITAILMGRRFFAAQKAQGPCQHVCSVKHILRARGPPLH